MQLHTHPCQHPSSLCSLADRAIIEQMIFGHTSKDKPYAKQLEQQAKDFIPDLEEFTQSFLDDLLRISQVVLRGLALALGQQEDFFVKVPFLIEACCRCYGNASNARQNPAG